MEAAPGQHVHSRELTGGSAILPPPARRSSRRAHVANLPNADPHDGPPFRQAVRGCDPGSDARAAATARRDHRSRTASTAYGREHGFASIQTMAQWRRQVPVVDYEDLRPWVDRMARGEESVLTAEVPVLFARTSGTAGEPKLIPVTRTCRQDHAEQIRTWFFHAWSDHPTIWSGKLLSLVSPAVEGYTDAGIPYGSASGHTYRSLPAVARRAYAIPYDVFEIRDYEAQYYTIMRIGARRGRPLPRHRQPFLDPAALRDGGPARRPPARGPARRHAAPRPRRPGADPRVDRSRRSGPMPARARQLEEARRRRRGRLLPADYWPDLALIGCWNGGTVGGHVHRFGPWFDPDGARGRARARLGMALIRGARQHPDFRRPARRRALRRHRASTSSCPPKMLEADPEGRTRWRFRSADELENGDEYYAFLTTTGGLYRYDINDVIAVVGAHNGAPVDRVPPEGPRGHEPDRREGERRPRSCARSRPLARDLAIPIDHFKAEADADADRYVFRVEARDGIPAARARRIPARARRRAGPPQRRVLREAQEQPAEGPAAPRDARRVVRPREEAAGRRRPAPVPGEDGHPLAGGLPRTRRRHRGVSWRTGPPALAGRTSQ